MTRPDQSHLDPGDDVALLPETLRVIPDAVTVAAAAARRKPRVASRHDVDFAMRVPPEDDAPR